MNETKKENLDDMTLEELQKLLDKLEKKIDELEDNIKKHKQEKITLLSALRSLGKLAKECGASIEYCIMCDSPVIIKNYHIGDKVFCTNPMCEAHIKNKLIIGPNGRVTISK